VALLDVAHDVRRPVATALAYETSAETKNARIRVDPGDQETG
jgi:hypothetical protein